MARFRVNCEGCGFTEVVDDAAPPAGEAAADWDAERAAVQLRDDHQVSEGHSVTITQLE